MKPTLSIIALGACLFIGFTAGRLTSPQDKASLPTNKTTPLATRKKARTFQKPYTIHDPEQMAHEELLKSAADQNTGIIQLALADWCQTDPEGALAFALEHEREDWIYYCLGIYGRTNADSALGWIEANTLDMALLNRYQTSVYQGLAIDNPELAIDRVTELPQGPLRNQILQSVAAQWALSDVSSVFDWIETQEPSPLLSSIYGQAMTRYIMQSPEEAIGLIAELTDSADKKNFSSRVAFELAKKNPQQALEWVKSISSEQPQSAQLHSAQMGLMEQWGKRPDSLQALEYVQELPDSDKSRELVSMLTMKMAHSFPDTLAREIPNLTEEQQEVAAAQLARAYSNTTPDKMIPWLDSLQSTQVRDRAVITALSSFRHTNVKQAFELSTSINDYNDRRDEVQKTLLEWLPVDPEGAMNALAHSSLPEDLKEAMAQNLAAQNPEIKDFLLPAKTR